MRPRAKAVVVGSLATALWICMPAIADAQPPIRVGASISQTGPYAAPAQNQLRGYRLCVKHINDKGGVLRRKLELIVEDDRSQPATATGIRQLKALNVNPRMFAGTAGVDLPRFYEILGRDAEFVYGASQWVEGLVTLRAGG